MISFSLYLSLSPSPSTVLLPLQSLVSVWVAGLRDAVCVDAIHRFKLILFGCAKWGSYSLIYGTFLLLLSLESDCRDNQWCPISLICLTVVLNDERNRFAMRPIPFERAWKVVPENVFQNCYGRLACLRRPWVKCPFVKKNVEKMMVRKLCSIGRKSSKNRILRSPKWHFFSKTCKKNLRFCAKIFEDTGHRTLHWMNETRAHSPLGQPCCCHWHSPRDLEMRQEWMHRMRERAFIFHTKMPLAS